MAFYGVYCIEDESETEASMDKRHHSIIVFESHQHLSLKDTEIFNESNTWEYSNTLQMFGDKVIDRFNNKLLCIPCFLQESKVQMNFWFSITLLIAYM